jgi:hypothetical protein
MEAHAVDAHSKNAAAGEGASTNELEDGLWDPVLAQTLPTKAALGEKSVDATESQGEGDEGLWDPVMPMQAQHPEIDDGLLDPVLVNDVLQPALTEADPSFWDPVMPAPLTEEDPSFWDPVMPP